MRRRIGFIAAVLLCVTAVLAGCGTKDANSVVKELDKTVSTMESYHGTGKMILHTGEQPLQYDVDVSYQKPNYYRIALTNAKKDITQIVLRNDEGVFVLTPRLNKVFRFQSDWPANQGQVYLYQTLVQSILLDNSRQFTTDKDAYVFDVMANYQNGSLARQKIWLNKSDYAPRQVEVSDTNAAVMVEVKFDKFEFDSKLDKSVFDTQRNMGGSTSDKPTIAEPDNGNDNSADNGSSNNNMNANAPDDNANANTPDNNSGNNADSNTGADPDRSADGNANNNADNNANSDNNANDASATDNNQANNNNAGKSDNNADDAMAPADGGQKTDGTFIAMEPSYLPEGVSVKDTDDIQFGGNPGVMIRYTGTYDYTLIETQPSDVAASVLPGTMVDLGFTYGSISGDDQKTLIWTYNGMEYRLTSGTLPEPEMTKVAQSVQEEMGK